jgi:DNA-binding response OmpR family regulator
MSREWGQALAESATSPSAYQEDLIEAGNLVLNLANYRVTVAGLPVDLTYHEFDLLWLLASRADRIVDFRELTQALWKAQGHKEVRRLNVLAFRLRAKLANSASYRVDTVRGRGYGLVRSQPGEGRNGKHNR